MDVAQAELTSEEAKRSLDHLRLRLADVLGDLRPTSRDLGERLQAVLVELESIRDEVELVYHVSQAEKNGLPAKLEEIDRRLAEGWQPDASPVEDVVERLRPFAQR